MEKYHTRSVSDHKRSPWSIDAADVMHPNVSCQDRPLLPFHDNLQSLGEQCADISCQTAGLHLKKTQMVTVVLKAGHKMCSLPSVVPDFSSFLLLVVRQLPGVSSQAMTKFGCLRCPLKCLAWVCYAQSWHPYSPSSQNHLDISHLPFLRGKGCYRFAILFEHGDVPNHGRLQQKARVHQLQMGKETACNRIQMTSCAQADECLLMDLPYNHFTETRPFKHVDRENANK